MGNAGCGKTALSVAAAIAGLEKGAYEKVLLTRVNVEAGERIGFLKGTEEEKNAPWIGPMLEEFKHWMGDSNVERYLKEKKIEHKHIQLL